eukprot:SAG11_NODE_26503_length_344_cov_0.844898_1_plen_43_part_10
MFTYALTFRTLVHIAHEDCVLSVLALRKEWNQACAAYIQFLCR